ncbi:MAG: DUF4185 domain-containing protein [bacterium]
MRFAKNILTVVICVNLWLYCFSGIAFSKPLSFSVVPYPEYNTLIVQASGWTGADGAYSTPISDNVTLWLYGDSWIGDLVNGKHSGGTMVNNTIAIQNGKNPKTATLNFYWHTDTEGKPVSFITPADGNGWFWPQATILVNSKLYIFLSQIISIKGKPDSIWNFQGVGTWIAEVLNPLDNPNDWKINQYHVPFGKFREKGTFSFGPALLQDNNYIYIYGCKDEPRQWFIGRNMIIARVPATQITDFNQWRFYHQGSWIKQPDRSSYLFNALAPEYSVNYIPYLKQYVCVYTELGMSEKIILRTAAKPQGPWSQPHTIYRCPEVSWNTTYFCYAAKAHPELSLSSDELVITYVCNSNDFWQMAADSRIYFPKYLKLKFIK